MTEIRATDPTEQNRWGAMRLLWAAMTKDVDRIYCDAHLDGLEDRFVMELVRLHTRGPMTLRELSASVERSPVKVARKVAEMEALGFVTTASGEDRTVAVTAVTERLVDRMMAEWEATEAAIAESEYETPYPLSKAFKDLAIALQRKSFHDRIHERLAQDPRWPAADRTATDD